MSENQEQNVDPTLVGIAIAVGQIKTAQDDLRRELVGNGQPGRLTKLETEVADLKKNHWLITGGLVAAGHGIRALLMKLGII